MLIARAGEPFTNAQGALSSDNLTESQRDFPTTTLPTESRKGAQPPTATARPSALVSTLSTEPCSVARRRTGWALLFLILPSHQRSATRAYAGNLFFRPGLWRGRKAKRGARNGP